MMLFCDLFVFKEDPVGRCFQVVKLSVPKGPEEQDQCSSSEDDRLEQQDKNHAHVLYLLRNGLNGSTFVIKKFL